MKPSIWIAWTTALLMASLGALGRHDGGGGDFCVPPSGSERFLKLIVPFPAGGTTDIMARALEDGLKQASRLNVIVENVAGAAGTIGVNQLLNSRPNGCTLLVSNRSPIVLAPAINLKGAERARELAPIAQLGEVPYILVARVQSDLNDAAALRKAAAAGTLTYGSPGNGSASHLAGAALSAALGGRMTHIPYRGVGPLVTDLLGGQLALAWLEPGQAVQHVRSGRLRALAVSGRARLPDLPAVPTIQEAGLGNVGYVDSVGVYASKAVVEGHADQLANVLMLAANDPRVKEAMVRLGLQAAPLGPAAFAESVRIESERWSSTARTLGIKGE